MPSSGLPRVRFLCGVTEVIRTDRWTVQVTGGQHLSRQQLPLQLAWAMSIHKSQVTIRCRGEQNRMEWAGYAEPRMASNSSYNCRGYWLVLICLHLSPGGCYYKNAPQSLAYVGAAVQSEPRASCLLGKHAPSQATPPAGLLPAGPRPQPGSLL